MRTHKHGAPGVLDRAGDGSARWREGILIGGKKIEIVAFAGAHDPGLDPLPDKDSVIWRLPATARVERGTVQDYPVSVGVQHGARPLAKGRVS
jgi:hypothetical protein